MAADQTLVVSVSQTTVKITISSSYSLRTYCLSSLVERGHRPQLWPNPKNFGVSPLCQSRDQQANDPPPNLTVFPTNTVQRYHTMWLKTNVWKLCRYIIVFYRVAQNKIPHPTICSISATSGLVIKILEAA